MNHDKDGPLRGVVLLVCVAALWVAWHVVHQYEAAACSAMSRER